MARRIDRPDTPSARQGRGAVSNPAGRFEAFESIAFDDGWGSLDDDAGRVKTVVAPERAKSIISYNDSPDIPFDRSLNPYRGCEHGCSYCYARPSHGYLGLSAGLDFETRLFAKVNAAELLRAELAKKSYKPGKIVIGVNTDAYQPIEREHRITRQILEVLVECGHPAGVITKSALVLRDVDLWQQLAQRDLGMVQVTVTTLDRALARKLEPRAPTPERRLEAIAGLARAGVPVCVMASPMIPGLNDHELEAILQRAKEAGAQLASYTLLRLPYEVRALFSDWLLVHAPGKAGHVLGLVDNTRSGPERSSDFGVRMRGQGAYAALIEQRFTASVRRLGLERDDRQLATHHFRPPQKGQLRLF